MTGDIPDAPQTTAEEPQWEINALRPESLFSRITVRFLTRVCLGSSDRCASCACGSSHEPAAYDSYKVLAHCKIKIVIILHRVPDFPGRVPSHALPRLVRQQSSIAMCLSIFLNFSHVAYADPPFDPTSIRLNSVKTPSLFRSPVPGERGLLLLLSVAL